MCVIFYPNPVMIQTYYKPQFFGLKAAELKDFRNQTAGTRLMAS
jgi:hypothetical protein